MKEQVCKIIHSTRNLGNTAAVFNLVERGEVVLIMDTTVVAKATRESLGMPYGNILSIEEASKKEKWYIPVVFDASVLIKLLEG